MLPKIDSTNDLSITDIRLSVLANWSPPNLRQAGELTSMSELWDELRKVETVGAWRSFIALCGQMLEIGLRDWQSTDGLQWLEASGRNPAHRFRTLIDHAMDSGMMEPPAKLTIISAMHTVRERRNTAAHFAPFARDKPDSTRATQTLALTICLLDWIYLPETQKGLGTSFPQANADDIESLRKYERGGSLPLGATWLNAYSHVLANASIKSAERILAKAAESRVPLEVLRSAVHQNFVTLIRRAGPSHVEDIIRMISRLNGLGMTSHVAVLRSMLPLGTLLLRALRDRRISLSIAYKLVIQTRQADKPLHSKIYNSPDTLSELLQALRSRLEDADVNLVAVANLVRQLPYNTQAYLWTHRFDKSLIINTRTRPLSLSIVALRSIPGKLAKKSPEVRTGKEALTKNALKRAIRTVHIDELHRALVASGRLNQDDFSSLSASLGRILLARIKGATQDAETRGEILWDIARLAGSSRDEICDEVRYHARTIANDPSSELLDWSLRDLLGMSPEPIQLDEGHLNVARNRLKAESVGWSAARILYPLAAQGRISIDLREGVQRIATLRPSDDMSKRLVEMFRIRQTE